jgi:Prohead core protein serine protease
MKLICEITEEIKVIKEGADDNAPKNYFIEGIFLQSELKNRNGRMYPQEMLQKEISRYVTEYVDKKRAFGELGHPDGPTINLDRVSHMITDLREDGTNFIGKAKILNTPNGNIVKALIDEGARLGVSSRGMGSIRTEGHDVQVVQDDFYLATAADIVADPSAPDAFVNGIMEGKEWVWQNGILLEKDIAELKKTITKAPAKQVKAVSVKAFESFIKKLEQK